MDLLEIHKRLAFLINKSQGKYFTYEEEDELLDLGQMSVFNDYYIEYQKSERINDALAPFKKVFTFSYGTTPAGLVSVPSDYFDATSITTVVQDASGVTRTFPCPRLNEDDIAARTNSRVIPLNISNPFAETLTNWNLQLYPKIPQAGTLKYLCRPPKPTLVYTIAGRVTTYFPLTSTQMAWSDKNIYEILLKCMQLTGINMRENDIMAWADKEDEQNVLTSNKA